MIDHHHNECELSTISCKCACHHATKISHAHAEQSYHNHHHARRGTGESAAARRAAAGARTVRPRAASAARGKSRRRRRPRSGEANKDTNQKSEVNKATITVQRFAELYSSEDEDTSGSQNISQQHALELGKFLDVIKLIINKKVNSLGLSSFQLST